MSVKQESYCIKSSSRRHRNFYETLDTVTAGLIRNGFIFPVEIPIDSAIVIAIRWNTGSGILIDGAIGKCRIERFE